MHLEPFILDLSLILIVASISTIIMKKLKQSVVLGYILAGFLISPNFQLIPTITSTETVSVWGEIGIIFLMFALGLEFSFKKISTVGGTAIINSLTVMTAMLFSGFFVGKLLGYTTMDCIFLGGMISISSTMIILKIFEECGYKDKLFAQLILGSLVIEDIFGIMMIIVLSTISISSNIKGLELVSDMGILFILLIVWLIVGIYFIPTVLKKISKFLSDEMLLIFSLALCFAMVLISNFIGFSSALGAFIAGSILAGTTKSTKIEHLILPIKDLFGAIFFVSVGMLIVPKTLLEHLPSIIILSIVVIVGQIFFSILGILLSGQSLKVAVQGGFCMCQIGEFSFIIASLGMSLGVTSDFLYPIIVCVSVITSFTSPILIKKGSSAYKVIHKLLPPKLASFLSKNTSAKQIEREKEDDWNRYLKRVFTRMLICASSMFVVYYVCMVYISPLLATSFTPTQSKVALTIITLLGMIPLSALMHGTNKTLFNKLWLKSSSNKLPLLTLQFIRTLIAALFISYTLHSITGFSFGTLFILSLAGTYLIISSDYIKGQTKRVEMSFIANFYEKALNKKRRDIGTGNKITFTDENIFVIAIKITNLKEAITIAKLGSTSMLNLGFIKVIRKGETISIPPGTFKLQNGDIIHAIGTRDEIETALIIFEEMDIITYIENPMLNLRSYIYTQKLKGIPADDEVICIPIFADANSFFVNKSIKQSGIREKYHGSVIGIERNMLHIPRPTITTIIKANDLIWIIGDNKMAEKMLKDDLLVDN